MIRRLLVALALCVLALPLAAQERILSYDSTIAINADGSLDITENIRVRAEGNAIRRGIYRDFPTRYKDRYGNNVVVDFKVGGVERDGTPEPWFTERKANGVRINTGNDDFLPVPADYTYTLRYRSTRQVGFFADHDELYFNAIGTGWEFPIERGTVEVRLPQPVPAARLHAEGYTGAQGEKAGDYDAELPAPGTAHWRLAAPLAAREGLAVVLTFPKGVVAEPGRAQRIAWFLQDNRGVLVALSGLLLLLGYCLRRWRQVGRDPRAGIIIAHYEPPPGHSPAGLRFMQRMGYDTRCFSADLLQLAVDGELRIERDKALLEDKWRLQRNTPAPASAPAIGDALATRVLLRALFPGAASTLELHDGNAATVQGAQAAHAKALKTRFEPALFDRNGGSIGIAAGIVLVSTALALLASGGAGVPAIIAILVLMLVALAVFGALVKAPTLAGRKLLDEIAGLKRYLGVAERDELARMPGPDAPPALDAKRYERLLPYAVALDVEEAWTRKFTLAVGAAAATAASAGIAWYHGSGTGDLGSLSQAIGNSLSSQIASSSSPPGSSSGSGGGGSSGGGGGGGGGGGR